MAAIEQLEAQAMAQERAFARAQASGMVPRIVLKDGKWQLHNDATGEMFAQVDSREEAHEMATEFLNNSEQESDDELTKSYRGYISSMMETMEAVAEKGVEQDFDEAVVGYRCLRLQRQGCPRCIGCGACRAKADGDDRRCRTRRRL